MNAAMLRVLFDRTKDHRHGKSWGSGLRKSRSESRSRTGSVSRSWSTSSGGTWSESLSGSRSIVPGQMFGRGGSTISNWSDA